MNMNQHNNIRREARTEHGFTLVELAVVVVIIGVLSSFAVPRLLTTVERSKAADAFKSLIAVRSAQETHQGRQGTYASSMDELDMELLTSDYFNMGEITAGKTGSLQDSWSVTFTRQGAAAGYGNYTVTFTESGYDKDNSTIELFPAIHPLNSK